MSADPSAPPALPSTADRESYVPISWLAVAAVVAAGVFVVLLVVGAAWAWRAKQPLLWESLLVLPAVPIVLGFAARRAIGNSEGTREGVRLAAAAWWVGVVGGLVYGAYFFAVKSAVRRDAEAQVEKWVGLVGKGDVAGGFHMTLDPGARTGLSAADAAAMEARYRDPFLTFRQTRLVRLAGRNAGDCRFEAGGLRDWEYLRGGLRCVYAGTLVCPEGRFAVAVPLRATDPVARVADEAAAGRQWQVEPDNSGAGYIASGSLTPYGWAVADLGRTGSQVGRDFVVAAAAARGQQLLAYARYALPGDPAAAPALLSLTPAGVTARQAVVGGGGFIVEPPAEWYARTADTLYALPDGSPPPDGKRGDFRTIWQAFGVVPAGARLRNTPDVGEGFAVTASAVEVRLPVELPSPGVATDMASRGRVVVACTDAAVLARLKELKAAADPVKGVTEQPPADLNLPKATWRVVRIESDLKPITPPRPGGGGRGEPD